MKLQSLSKHRVGAVLLAVGTALLLSGAALGKERSIGSLADVAGKWEGSAFKQNGDVEEVTLTLRDNGTFTTSSWQAAGEGKVSLKDGKLKFVGKQGTGTGILADDGDLSVFVGGQSNVSFAKLSKTSASASSVSVAAVADVAGKWEGSGYTVNGDVENLTLTVRKDGTYDAGNWRGVGSGKVALKGGKVLFTGKSGGGATGTLTQNGELVVYVKGASNVSLVKLTRNAAVVTGNSIGNLAEVAGKWEGTAFTENGDVQDVALTLREDGTYEASTWNAVGSGKAALKDGKLVFTGKSGGGATATLTQNRDLVVYIKSAGGILQSAKLARK